MYREVLADWVAAGAPDDARPGVLAAWADGRGQFAENVTEMAMTPGADHRAALAAFCVRNEIAPSRGTDWALFCVLTGQGERWKAHDPDGSLLAEADRELGTCPAQRTALREALEELGVGPDVMRTVLVSGRWIAEMAADEIEFLSRHDLTPEGAQDQACFFALSGQAERRLAVDPDGALLAAAYQGASPDGRAALRKAMESDADVDAVRVVADGGQRIAEITAAERKYLVGLLRERRDWAALWRLALELPVADAVRAVRHVDPQWHPEARRDRELFGLLAESSRADIRRARKAMYRSQVIHLVVPGKVRAGALSDDGRRVALWTHDSRPTGNAVWTEAPGPGTISVHSLPDGALMARHAATIWDDASLAYCGDTLAAFTVRHSRTAQEAWLHHCPQDGRPMELTHHDEHSAEHGAIAMAAFRDGLVTARLGNVIGFHDTTGREVSTLRYGERWTGQWSDYPPGYSSTAASITVDQESGRIAVMRAHYGVLLDEGERTEYTIPVVGKLTRPLSWRGVCLRGGDDLVVADSSELELWERPDIFERSYWERGADVTRRIRHGASEVTWIRARDEICYRSCAVGSANIHYVKGERLTPVNTDGELTGKEASVLFGSAGATCHAIGGDGYADIVVGEYQALGMLADRPQAAWQPDDLRTVTWADRLATGHHRAQPLHRLVRACLEHRFSDEETATAR
ncbi:hypothetical protein HLK59_03325 [Streptomyces sp. S3(2020)]|uniref:hypothetical protein n=1 Tax=Streptomyces sp. S3(2020) TaxID=2732044 RepID=UPI0014886275|nr:hypothetical protein [Streptomyces sp. S3(2020)]NNN29399.1 hypothetical protein [Streptomyces sp. S3(2020)]